MKFVFGDASPAPQDIAASRLRLGLTQAEAAAIVRSTQVTWQKWETGAQRMHPGLWELFNLDGLQHARSDVELEELSGRKRPRSLSMQQRGKP